MSTGILARDGLLINAWHELHSAGLDISIENLARVLPSDFALSQQDMDDMRETFARLAQENPPIIVGEFVAVEPTDTVQAPAADHVHDADQVGNEGPVPADAAQDRLVFAQDELGNARGALVGAQRREQESVVRLQRAASHFQRGLPHVSDDELRKDYCAASKLERAHAAHHGQPTNTTTRPGPSLIDRLAYYGRSTSAEGHGDFRRGSFSAANLGRRLAKPPSEL